jgi:hypothetical protein
MLVLGGLTAVLTAAAGQLLNQPTMVGAVAPCFELQTGSADGLIVAIHLTNPATDQVPIAAEVIEEIGRAASPLIQSRVVAVAPGSTRDVLVGSPDDGIATIVGNGPLVVNAEVIGRRGISTPRSTTPCRGSRAVSRTPT